MIEEIGLDSDGRSRDQGRMPDRQPRIEIPPEIEAEMTPAVKAFVVSLIDLNQSLTERSEMLFDQVQTLTVQSQTLADQV